MSEARGLMARAEKAYTLAVRLAPENTLARSRLGLFYRRNRLPQTEAHLRRTVGLSRGSAEACWHFGEFLESQGRWAEALRWLSTAQAKGADPAVEFRIGWVHGLRGNFGLMRRQFARFLNRCDPRVADPMMRLRALMGLGNYDGAFALAEMLLNSPHWEGLHRPWPDHWLHPATLRPSARKFYAGHLAALGRWARRHPKSPWPHFFRSCIQWRLYRLKAALDETEALRRLPENRYGWMRYFQGVLRLSLRQYSGARSDFEAALKSRPNFWHARCYLGETLLCLGQERAAWEEFERAELEGRAEARAWRGEALVWTGNFRQAVIQLDHAIEAGGWLGFCWRGAARTLLEDYEAALRDLDRAVLANPLDAEAYVWRGETKRKMGRWAEALKDLDRALALGGDSPWARWNRALVWASLGRPAAMRADFKHLPPRIVDPMLATLGRPRPRTDREVEETLRAGLALAGGIRREEDYLQDFWKKKLS